MIKQEEITTQGWFPFIGRRTVKNILSQSADLTMKISSDEFETHPTNNKMIGHVVEINNHEFLKGIDLKVLVKSSYQSQRWLKNKKIMVVVMDI